jgi:hypothetical protein
MPEISKKENQLQWICRILISINVLLIIGGYISFFQTKHQLDSPLIPRSTVYQIFADTDNMIMKASIISAGIFLAGFWFYSFNKKKTAIILFSACIISFKLLLL